ncbi:MAG: bifunctional folylpolyglutamate synthase/dihydrofolate synthase [Firmicutes bacterium HGW-Firmicutes-12]|nr:MAG: bifunctional folylpolyglutamate synthase/dihydrofolate synthase [Firmicutes bacterium HGW-Firmicutes-12]
MEEALRVLEYLTKFGINLGLERIKALLHQLDNPQKFLKVIHIAGTNGKGSTGAIISAVLQTVGYRVGAFTSPHLVSYTERISINGVPITEKEFAALLSVVASSFQKVQDATGENPTEFEVLTAMALLYFHIQQVDIVILEVGMGGDIDSTNVISAPLLSVITNVSIEHKEYLGASLPEIAEKKSGIIKAQRPVITASNNEAVLAVLSQKARDNKSEFHEVYREMRWSLEEETSDGQTFKLQSTQQEYGSLYLSLRGEHQVVNAATALLALEVLVTLGWRITLEDIRAGLSVVRWPGRLEVVNTEPLVLIDSAHNPAGMEVLANWLRKQRPKFKNVIFVIGMLADKDRAASVRYIDELVDKVIITKPPSSRAGDFEEMSSYFTKTKENIIVIESLYAALETAMGYAKKGDILLVAGSIYLIGEVRRYFQK